MVLTPAPMALPFQTLGLAACAVGVAAGVAAYVRPDKRGWWTSRLAFVLPLALALFVSQREAIGANFQLWNPDESEMIAGALTLQDRPVFWRDVDGNSHGPLNQFPLLLPALVGARLDYTSARVVGALMAVLLLVCLHAVLARRLGEGSARLLVLPGWAVFIFNQDPETAQYTSELPSSLMVLIALALVPWAVNAGRRSSLWCFLAGAACGFAPLGKLQSTPIAAWAGLFLLFSVARSPEPAIVRWRKAGLTCLGAVTPALVFVGLAAAGGAFSDFYLRFIETNLFAYVTEGEKYFNDAWPEPGMIFGFSQFLWPVVGVTVAALLTVLVCRPRLSGEALLFAAGLVAAALFAIYAPHHPFAHYFILLIAPLVLLLGATAGPVLDHWQTRAAPRIRIAGTLILLAVLIGPTMAHRLHHSLYFKSILRTRPPVAREMIEAVQRRVAPGERLAVWGWQPALYVFTQTTSATRDVIVVWQILPSRWREYYRASYLADFQARPPVVFVDTTGPADFFFHQADKSRHENFLALRDLIARDYVLAETAAGARVYVRRVPLQLP